jgi:phosphoadenosine phosphosulfate reductase
LGHYDFDTLNSKFQGGDPRILVEWASQEFGSRLAMATSFGAESAVLLHLVTRIVPKIPVLFTNTGFHFKETLEHRDRLVDILHLNLIELKPEMPNGEFLAKHGKLYERDPDSCCDMNKIAPFDKGLENYDAWITGVRRNQAQTRNELPYLQKDRETKVKICPLLDWDSKKLWEYAKQHDLPYHPLWEKGYLSIGCSPECCTRPVGAGEDPRAGRWAGKNKIECGIHISTESTPSPKA